MRFASCRFSPHRHDTYAIGVTTAGVQEFRYRGRRHICLPGQLHFLYPDETHDGGPATDAGFAYRILYAEPELVRDALGGRPLPFVAEPVQDGTPATRELRRLLDQIDDPVSDLGRHEAASAIAEALVALGGGTQREGRIDLAAVARVRSYIAAHASDQTPASTLERIAGIDRYAIARQFRRAYGTSPDRYRTMRRLALARTAIEEGVPLARAAADCRLCRPEPHDPPVRARLRADARAVGRDRRGLGPSLGRVIFAARPPDSGAWRVLPSDASAAPRNTGSVADTTARTSPGG